MTDAVAILNALADRARYAAGRRELRPRELPPAVPAGLPSRFSVAAPSFPPWLKRLRLDSITARGDSSDGLMITDKCFLDTLQFTRYTYGRCVSHACMRILKEFSGSTAAERLRQIAYPGR
jgi:hypothetical protein